MVANDVFVVFRRSKYAFKVDIKHIRYWKFVSGVLVGKDRVFLPFRIRVGNDLRLVFLAVFDVVSQTVFFPETA